MSLPKEITPKQWWAVGKVFKDALVCQNMRGISSSGIWYGDNPLSYPTPLIMIQITLIFFTSRGVYFLLQPLRQSMTVAQIIVSLAFFFFTCHIQHDLLCILGISLSARLF